MLLRCESSTMDKRHTGICITGR